MSTLRRPPAVARVLGRVTDTVREHDMLRPGDHVLACVSGGPDSMCLLETLVRLKRLFGIRVSVFHFDHQLRPDSAADSAYVNSACERLGVGFHQEVASGRPMKGDSVEAWATAARHEAAKRVSSRIGAGVIAEGHSLDDQAETVLLNLARGTGLEGVAGILPVWGSRPKLIQPLIDVERQEVEAFCRALHLKPRRDPMNEDRTYMRSAIRHEVLPVLERATGRGVKRAIARTTENLRADREELERQAVSALREIVTHRKGEEVRFDAAKLRGLPEPIANRVVRLAVYDLSGDQAAPWPREAIVAVLDLARGRPGRRRDLPEGRVARRDRTHVVVERRGRARLDSGSTCTPTSPT